jgi:glucosamine 6-phosphate synthetase-like amidotransferase/phosphosugar isomerase protein
MSDMPELRDGPPWAMEEMILAEPGLVAAIFASPEAFEAAEWIRETETVVITGCGTSEHAAMAGAALLGARARDAFEASLDPQAEGVLIAVSHEAGTAATLAAMQATGARSILITARPELETGADLTIATPLVDTSWCHTVGYVSPLLAFTAIAGTTDAATAQQVIEDTLAQRPKFKAAAQALIGCERLIVTGSGLDEITARELALKIEEGLHVPVTPLGLEKVLHGHLPAADARTGIVVLRIDPSAAEQRDKRAQDVRAAVAELDMPAVTIDGLPEGHPLLAGAIALQLLTYELVLAAGTNPDLIRREEDAYRAAAAAANT